jgi:RNA polymerase sigma-70 factor (ECF subfamily)
MEEPSDVELIRRLRGPDRAGREAAFAELYRRHAPRSHRLAFRVIGDSDLAADAVQEAFLTVYRKGARFEGRAQFTSWLFRVVVNRSIDLRRKSLRRTAERGAVRPGSDEPPPDPADAPSPEAGPPEAVRAAERTEAVREAIAQLSPKLAEVVLLRYPEGLSYEEIGGLLGLPPGTVRSRLNRAHAALRAILGPSLADEEGGGIE